MTEQMKAATIRALYGALLTFGSVFFVTYQTEIGVIRSERVENAAVAACAAFFAYMLARGVTEGIIDSHRGPTKADVGQ